MFSTGLGPWLVCGAGALLPWVGAIKFFGSIVVVAKQAPVSLGAMCRWGLQVAQDMEFLEHSSLRQKLNVLSRGQLNDRFKDPGGPAASLHPSTEFLVVQAGSGDSQPAEGGWETMGSPQLPTLQQLSVRLRNP